MMRFSIDVLCILSCAAINLRTQTKVEAAGHPIVKVIDLLKDLKAKSKEEGANEEIAYAKFSEWCRVTINAVDKEIATHKDNIEVLMDKVEAGTSDKAMFTAQLEDLDAELAAQGASKTKATEAREAASKLFSDADADYAATIQAIDSCITALEGAKEKTATLTQTGSNSAKPDMKQVRAAQDKLRGVMAFLEMRATSAQMQNVQQFLGLADEPIKAEGDAEKHVKDYTFKSGSVIELLKGLKEKFEDEKQEGIDEETNAQNAFLLQMEDLKNAIAKAEKSKGEKTKILGETTQALAGDTAEKGTEEEALTSAESMLRSTKTDCDLKATEWSDRSKMREGEIEAIDAGIAILTKVSGVRSEAPNNPKYSSFLQLSSEPIDAKTKAVQLLRTAAKRSHSKALERLAMALEARSDRVSAGSKEGPFDAIINMIQKMIDRLMDDQNEENKHKAWCDKELAAAAEKESESQEKVDDKSKEIELLEAKAATLTKDIASEQEKIDGLTTKMAELTEIRAIGKKENAEAMDDAKKAINAISEATAIITDFYKSSGAVAKEAWEFMQTRRYEPEAKPSTWEKSYSGVADPEKQPSGIITVLETVSADFSKMLADTQAQESTDQESYQEEMSACKIQKKEATHAAQLMSEQKKRTTAKATSEKQTLKGFKKSLAAVQQYVKDLQPPCVEATSTYEKRVAARQDEIDALEKAEVILKKAFTNSTSS